MLRWLATLFRRRPPDDDPTWVIEVASIVTEAIMKGLSVQFKMAQCSPDNIPQHKEFFVACYLAGFCDVMAQSTGARAGGNLSMTVSAQIMQKIFGNTHGDYMWCKVDKAMRTRDSLCLKAMLIGAKDANSGFQRNATFNLAAYLSEAADSDP